MLLLLSCFTLQALQFIQVCLAAVLNLRAPEDASNAPEECRWAVGLLPLLVYMMVF
jgi:hypothetical protein